jgi:hypothetical protein
VCPLVLAVLAGLVTASAAQPKPLGKVIVGLGVAKTFSFLPAFAAEDLGTWKKRGLEAEIVAFAGDAKLQQAFAAGAVDVALGGVAGSLVAISKGQETRLVGGLANSVALMGLVAHPELFQRKMDTSRDIGARVWDFDAHKLVDDGLFSDKALLTAAQAIRETGAITEVPPLPAWVDKRFLPVRWKR